jgi:hypothetical protein
MKPTPGPDVKLSILTDAARQQFRSRRQRNLIATKPAVQAQRCVRRLHHPSAHPGHPRSLAYAASSGAQQATRGSPRGNDLGRSEATGIVVDVASVDVLWRSRAISLRSRRAVTKSSCHFCILLERAVSRRFLKSNLQPFCCQSP